MHKVWVVMLALALAAGRCAAEEITIVYGDAYKPFSWGSGFDAKGVQRDFLKVAGHPRLSGKAGLRSFLFKFGLEEEAHYKVAEIDLDRMGEKPLPCPLDVSLWWAYFDQIVEHRPFVRLGATCVLENLGAGAGALGHRLLDEAPFLNKGNTRFLTIHFHELLPHGDQIINALTSVEHERRSSYT